MKTPKIKFQLNLKLDAKNYYDASNSTKTWGHDFSKSARPEIVSKVRGKKFEEVKKYLIDILSKGYSKDTKRTNRRFSSW